MFTRKRFELKVVELVNVGVPNLWNFLGWGFNNNKGMKNKAKKAVSRAMTELAEEVLTEFKNCPNDMLSLVKGLMIFYDEVEGGGCMRG